MQYGPFIYCVFGLVAVLTLPGCGNHPLQAPVDLKKGDEVLVRRYEGGAYVYDRLSLTDVQGDKVQFAGNPRYFPLSEMTWQKVIKAEAE